MKMIMQSTNVRLPKAPMVRPIIEMSKLSVGQDLANLNTRSCSSSNLIAFFLIYILVFVLWGLSFTIGYGGS